MVYISAYAERVPVSFTTQRSIESTESICSRLSPKNVSSAVTEEATTLSWKIFQIRNLSGSEGTVVAMVNYSKGHPMVLLCILKIEYTVTQVQTHHAVAQKVRRQDGSWIPSDQRSLEIQCGS